MDISSMTGFTIGSLFGLFDLVAGLLLVAAILTFGGGLATYFGRLGLAVREESILTLEWGVRLLFVLVLMLGLVQYVQNHTAVVLELLAILILIGLGYLALTIVQTPHTPPEDH